MRALLIGTSLIAVLSAQIGLAADIDYKLSVFDVPKFGEHKDPKPFSIEMQDRVWAATGIEAGTRKNGHEVARQADDSAFERKVQAGELYHVCFKCAWPRYQVAVVEKSHWLEDEMLPRTRETIADIEREREAREEARQGWLDSGYVF